MNGLRKLSRMCRILWTTVRRLTFQWRCGRTRPGGSAGASWFQFVTPPVQHMSGCGACSLSRCVICVAATAAQLCMNRRSPWTDAVVSCTRDVCVCSEGTPTVTKKTVVCTRTPTCATSRCSSDKLSSSTPLVSHLLVKKHATISFYLLKIWKSTGRELQARSQTSVSRTQRQHQQLRTQA